MIFSHSYRYVKPSLLLLILSSLGMAPIAANSEGSEPKTSPAHADSNDFEFEALTKDPLERASQWRSAVDQNGELWIAYYDANRHLWLRNPQGAYERLGAKDGGGAPSGLAMSGRTDSALVAWRDKLPVKGLFVYDPLAKEPLEVSGGSQALARFQLIPGETGTHILWHGERMRQDSGSQYNIHYTFLHDDGQVDEQQWLMPGLYPVGVADGNAFTAFSWVTEGTDRPHIAMRRRDAESVDFSPPVTLDHGIEEMQIFFEADRSGDNWFVVWQTMERDGVFGYSTDGLRSSDGGETWEKVRVPALDGFGANHLSVAMKNNEIVLLVSGVKGIVPGRPRGLEEWVIMVRSSDGGATWESPVPVREPSGNSRVRAAHVFNGKNPGELWIVWEDWREIRPRVYGAFSRDFGKSFVWQDQPISPSKLNRVSLSANHPVHVTKAEKQKLIVREFFGDDFDQHALVPILLDPEALPDENVDPDRRMDEDYLKSRVEAYWAAMVEEDFSTTFELHDPFMRSAWGFRTYAGRLGMIKYEGPTVRHVSLDGWVADVAVEVDAWVPRFRGRGGDWVEVPRRTVPILERWLFIDGDWYREYSEEGSELRLTKYR